MAGRGLILPSKCPIVSYLSSAPNTRRRLDLPVLTPPFPLCSSSTDLGPQETGEVGAAYPTGGQGEGQSRAGHRDCSRSRQGVTGRVDRFWSRVVPDWLLSNRQGAQESQTKARQKGPEGGIGAWGRALQFATGLDMPVTLVAHP